MSLPAPPRLLVLVVLVIMVNTQSVYLVAAGITGIGNEFGFGPVGLGALTAAYFLTASMTSTPLGHVVERIGWQRSMRINLLVAAALSLLIALIARDLWVFTGLLVLSGMNYGVANPAANRALADHVDPHRRATVFGIKHAGIPSSTLLAGLAVPLVITTLGWRWAYGFAALAALAVFVLMSGLAARADDVSFDADPRRDVAPLGRGRLIAMATVAALGAMAAAGLGTYLVSAALDKGFSDNGAGILLFVGSAVSIAGRISAGLVTDRQGGRGFYAIAWLMGVGSVVLILLGFSVSPWFAVLSVAAFATAWAWPGLMTYTVVNANTDRAASATGITQAGVFIGAGVGPLILGTIAEQVSFGAMWVTVGFSLAAAATIAGWVGHHAPMVDQS